MPTSLDPADVPLQPDDRACSGGCGKLIAPEWIPGGDMGTIRLKGRWAFDDPCEACAARLKQEEDDRADRARRAEAIRKVAELLGSQEVAERFTFDNYVPKTESQRLALQEARSFSPSTENLYMWGGKSGTGKSHLAGAIVRAASIFGLKVEYWKASRLSRAFRKLDHMEYEKAIRRLVMADLFVLDDLGVGTTTDFSLAVLYDIVDERETKCRKGLVVTSNLSLGKVTEKFNDDRLSSRLAGLCQGHIIEIDGPDGRIV